MPSLRTRSYSIALIDHGLNPRSRAHFPPHGGPPWTEKAKHRELARDEDKSRQVRVGARTSHRLTHAEGERTPGSGVSHRVTILGVSAAEQFELPCTTTPIGKFWLKTWLG